MILDHLSEQLFGRYQALRIYVTIARLSKDEFTTGQVVKLSGAAESAVSGELQRLCKLGSLSATSRRGTYRRENDSVIWQVAELLSSDEGRGEPSGLGIQDSIRVFDR